MPSGLGLALHSVGAMNRAAWLSPSRPLVRSSSVRHRPPSGVAPAGDPGHSLPLVALELQWRQDYPNKRPPTRATAISEMGQLRPPALQNEDRGSALRFCTAK
jgi:hypothetical protein